jgi:uncharacterized protein YbgA (DUF1722 family)
VNILNKQPNTKVKVEVLKFLGWARRQQAFSSKINLLRNIIKSFRLGRIPLINDLSDEIRT